MKSIGICLLFSEPEELSLRNWLYLFSVLSQKRLGKSVVKLLTNQQINRILSEHLLQALSKQCKNRLLEHLQSMVKPIYGTESAVVDDLWWKCNVFFLLHQFQFIILYIRTKRCLPNTFFLALIGTSHFLPRIHLGNISRIPTICIGIIHIASCLFPVFSLYLGYALWKETIKKAPFVPSVFSVSCSGCYSHLQYVSHYVQLGD